MHFYQKPCWINTQINQNVRHQRTIFVYIVMRNSHMPRRLYNPTESYIL